jgi:V/A-type H+-transporting ATPase subunit I
MAIVKMKRLFLAALTSDREHLLSELMRLSCVELSAPDAEEGNEEIAQILRNLEVSRGDADSELKLLGTTIDALEQYDKSKKPLFRALTPTTPEDARSKALKSEAVAEQANAHLRRMSELKNEENKLTAIEQSLRPYEALDIDLSLTQTVSTIILVGTVPVELTQEQADQIIREADAELIFRSIGKDEDIQTAFVLYPKDREDAGLEVLKALGFQRTAFRDMTGTPAQNIAAIEKRCEEIHAQRAAEEEALTALTAHLPDLQAAYDSKAVDLQKQYKAEEFLYSDRAFFAQGWVPAQNLPALEKVLAACNCSYEVRDPTEENDVPVKLQNSKFADPFSSITELYSLPQYSSVDPTPFLAVSYAIFFGLMLGDAVFGALLAIGGFFVVKKFRMRGFIGRLITTFAICGVFTVAVGVLFGSYVGDIIPQVAMNFFGVEIGGLGFAFDMMVEPMKMIVLCVVAGLIHIFVGMALQAYLLIKEGRPWAALFDVGFWYIFIIGLILLAFSPEVGKWMAIASGLGLILTQGRDKKNPVMKILSGILALYDITGYLSDVLSYLRIFALALSSGVIASVFNTMATLPGPNVVGIIVFVVVFAFGTVLNFALSGLSAFVHAARLQYVEFFTKFFVGGGRPFQPIEPKTKYILMTDKEAN